MKGREGGGVENSPLRRRIVIDHFDLLRSIDLLPETNTLIAFIINLMTLSLTSSTTILWMLFLTICPLLFVRFPFLSLPFLLLSQPFLRLLCSYFEDEQFFSSFGLLPQSPYKASYNDCPQYHHHFIPISEDSQFLSRIAFSSSIYPLFSCHPVPHHLTENFFISIFFIYSEHNTARTAVKEKQGRVAASLLWIFKFTIHFIDLIESHLLVSSIILSSTIARHVCKCNITYFYSEINLLHNQDVRPGEVFKIHSTYNFCFHFYSSKETICSFEAEC